MEPTVPEDPTVPDEPNVPEQPAVPGPGQPPADYVRPTPYAVPAPVMGGLQYGSARAEYAHPFTPHAPRGMAITSMVLGLVAVLVALCPLASPVLGIPAVILGHLAFVRQPHARGFAVTGLVTGYLGVGVGVLTVIDPYWWLNLVYALG